MSKMIRKRPWEIASLASLVGLVVCMTVAEVFAMRTRTDASVMNYATPINAATQGTTPFYGPAEVGTPGGVKAAYQTADFQCLSVFVDCTSAPSATVTPTLILAIQHSIDATVWAQHTALTTITGTGVTAATINNLARYWRLKGTLNVPGGGTTVAWTFTVKAYSKEFTESEPALFPVFAMRYDASENGWIGQAMSIALPRYYRVEQTKSALFHQDNG